MKQLDLRSSSHLYLGRREHEFDREIALHVLKRRGWLANKVHQLVARGVLCMLQAQQMDATLGGIAVGRNRAEPHRAIGCVAMLMYDDE